MIEIWDNPLFDAESNLEVCKGAVIFQREVNKNIREQLERVCEALRDRGCTDSYIELVRLGKNV